MARLLRLRVLRLELLTGQIVWYLPFLIVLAESVFGIDAYKFIGAKFIASNLSAGLLLIPISIWLAKQSRYRLENSTSCANWPIN